MIEEEIIVTEDIVEVPAEVLPYGDLYLKFADEAQSIEVLEGYEGSIDIIGTLYAPVSSFDDENGDAAVVLPGWHVNTRGPMNHILGAYSVEVPTNPRRVWA